MSMAAIGIGVGTTLLGAGLSYAMRPSYQSSNLPASSRELSNANAALLPFQRGMAAAAQEGRSFTFTLPEGVDAHTYGFDNLPQGSDTAHQTQVYIPGRINQADTKLDWSNLANLNPRDRTLKVDDFLRQQAGSAPTGRWVNYDPKEFEAGGKYADLGKPVLRDVIKQNGTYTVNFKGFGAGETQSIIAKQAAAGQLALAQKYDSRFIANALKEEKEADPNSFAARQRMSELIQQQIDHPIGTPTADLLAKQVGEQVKAGKGLDDFDKSVLDDAVTKSLGARGGSNVAADYSQPLTTGAAGNARQQAGIQKGIAELSSGSSPEDIAYRREQQNLANLSAEINGQTPQSQFASLSGAQRGPTPVVSGQPLPMAPSNAAQTGSQFAIQGSGLYNNALAGQANPWLAGLGTLISGAGAVAQAQR